MAKETQSQSANQEVQLVVFKLGPEEFGVDIQQVREIVKFIPITPIPRSPKFIEGVFNLRGHVSVVIDLSKRLSLPLSPRTEKTRIIVVEIDGNTVGMIVDEVTEVLRLSKDKIVETPHISKSEISEKYITGIGKLEDDRLLILIDLSVTLSFEEIEDVKEITDNNKDAG